MSEQTQTPNPNTPTDQEPLIPPVYMLVLAVIGFIVALVVLLTQPEFTVVGWGGLGIMLLSIIAWVFMAPDQARAILTGRTAKYGGTTLLVTILFLGALVAVYAFAKGRDIRIDLTQRDIFSLNEQTRQAIAGLAVEPNVPNIKIYAFYTAAQAANRDQDTILFDDYAKTSQNKISYEFVDPDRSPALAQSLKITRAGQIAVAPLDDSGQPLVDKAQAVSASTQEDISNAILRVAASGDFRAYFLTVDDGLKFSDSGDGGLSQLNDVLTNTFNWKTQAITFLDLANPNSEVKLNDTAADGEVLVIPGGSKALTDDQLKYITDFLDKGGRLVLFAAPINGDGSPSLATSENLNQYLMTNFGLSFKNDVVMDLQQAFQYPFNPVVADFDSTSFVTQNVSRISQQGLGAIFTLPHSIDVAATPTANVSVVSLARTGAESFEKTDASVLTGSEAITKADTDAQGPFVVAASAENTSTGARVVLIGSRDVSSNAYAGNTSNLLIGRDSLIWATKFEEFFTKIPQLDAETKPQDTPIYIDAQTSRNINFLTIIVIPFGILLVGIFVWWNGREKAR